MDVKLGFALLSLLGSSRAHMLPLPPGGKRLNAERRRQLPLQSPLEPTLALA
jgi:hypothetical protein